MTISYYSGIKGKIIMQEEEFEVSRVAKSEINKNDSEMNDNFLWNKIQDGTIAPIKDLLTDLQSKKNYILTSSILYPNISTIILNSSYFKVEFVSF